MARRAGWRVNNKRIRRLWREEGVRVSQRRRKKRLTGIGVAVGAMSPICPNVIWAMDFQFDTTGDGRTLKMLNVIDEFQAARQHDAAGGNLALEPFQMGGAGLVDDVGRLQIGGLQDVEHLRQAN